MLDRSGVPPYSKVKNIKLKKAESVLSDNGIPIHYLNFGHQPVIKTELVIPAGKWYESKNGLSYFTSQMLAEGTKEKSSAEISEAFDMYGAQFEISAGNDLIMISVQCLKKYFENIINILHEIIYQPVFPETEFNKLVKREIQHLRIQNSRNSNLASKYFRKALFGEYHPYGYYKTEDAINKLSIDDLKKYYRNQILSSKSEFLLSGDVQEEHLKLINKMFQFQGINNGSKSQNFKPEQENKDLTYEKKGSLQSSLRIGKRIISKNHPDYHKLSVATNLLGGFFGSRLMKNLREDKGLTYGIYASNVNLMKDSFFVINTDVRKDLRENALAEILKEVDKLRKEPPSNNELDLVKNHILGSFQGEVNTPFELAEKFKVIYFHGLNYDFYSKLINTVNNISPDEISDIAVKYFDPESFTTLRVG